MVVNPGRTGQDGGHSETHYPWIQDHNSGIRSRYIFNGNIFRLNQDFTDPNLTEPKSSTHKWGRISSTCKLQTSLCVFYRNLSLIVIFQWGMRSEGLKKYLNICRFQLLVYRASVTSVNFVTWDQAKIKYHLALCHEIWLKICHLRSVKIKYPCQVAASAHTIIQCHCLFRSFIKILHVKIYIHTSPFILNKNAICFIPFLDS